MKSLVALWVSLHRDACVLYSLNPAKDVQYVLRRHGEEGDPFLAITLDAFRVAFEAALERGTWDSPVGFRTDGHLPAFLRGFVSLVFQRNGTIRQSPDWRAVAIIRQLTGFAAKQFVLPKEEYSRKALESFIETDEGATSLASPALKAVFATLFDPVMRAISDKIASGSLLPKHGNGASAERLKPNSRWNFATWDHSLEAIFPFGTYACLNDRHLMATYDTVEFVAAEEHPVRVTLVPKTAKGPRVIACEPSWRMYIQQALLSELVSEIEAAKLPPRFSDSSLNRRLAKRGSEDGSLATIDLSSASDSVSNRLVIGLTSGRPLFRDALQAARSSRAILPDGTVRTLQKFASMGSATCFPVEAMVFTAIAVLAMCEKDRNGFPVLDSVRRVSARVTVYGDDIIVPSAVYSDVCSQLKLFGFSVNERKSFHKGSFRESCGGDYFLGHDVSYVKVRRPLSGSRQTAKETVSTVSLRNQLAAKGFYPSTVFALDLSLIHI